MISKCNFKASIIGCGSVGSTTAYSYLLSGAVTDLVLMDANADRANGLLLDLKHSLSFTPNVCMKSTGDPLECVDSDIVIITAGARQEDGETRLDLVNKNKAIFADLIPKLVKASPDAIFIIVSNPVDVLTYKALKLSGLPANRVFGSGTVLDSSRLQFHISQRIKIHPSSIDAYILGEHGDTSFPVYSSANVLGKSLYDFEGFSDDVADECYQETKNAAYRIIHDQGYTCYSIATAIREITEAIFENKYQVFPLSVMLDDYHGHSDVCLSVPCVLGRNGIENVLDIPLNNEEYEALAKSVKTLKGYL